MSSFLCAVHACCLYWPRSSLTKLGQRPIILFGAIKNLKNISGYIQQVLRDDRDFPLQFRCLFHLRFTHFLHFHMIGLHLFRLGILFLIARFGGWLCIRLRTIHFTKNGGGRVCYLGFIGPVSISPVPISTPFHIFFLLIFTMDSHTWAWPLELT